MHLISSGVLIRHVHAVTSPEGSGWRVACSAEVINLGEEPRELTVKATVAGAQCSSSIVAVPGTTMLNWEMLCDGVQMWSPDNPALYLLETELLDKDCVKDDLVERIGFRTVSLSGEEILLNGKKIFPMGFNRHEDHALLAVLRCTGG